MKKTLLFGCAITLLLGANANAADFQQYAAVRGGYSLGDVGVEWDGIGVENLLDIDEDVLGVSLAYGLKKDAVRSEVELNWNDDADAEGLKWKDRSIMLNAYYDIPTGTKLTPYIGGGIGLAFLELKGDGEKEDSTEFAYQLGAGVSYAINDNWGMDAGYRYIKNGSLSWTDATGNWDVDTSRQQFYVGMRYTF